jgi:hypothetical protein
MLFLAHGLAAPPARSAKPAKPGIRAEVRFTVKELDPKAANGGFLECVVHNGTGKPIKVPAGYARGFDSDVVVFGESTGFRWPMRLVQHGKVGKENKPAFAVVKPGESAVVFKKGLSELLIPRKGVEWTWQA